MSLDTLPDFFREGSEYYIKVLRGIPKTAKIIRTGITDPPFPNFYIIFEDESIPEVKEGETLLPVAVQIEAKRAEVLN